MTEGKVSKFTQDKLDAAENQIQQCSKRIEYFVTEFTIEILAQKMKDAEYEIPGYQREFTWDEHRKWRFIESVLMGLPIPFLFFWENPESGKLEIVDGSQRLRTLEEYVNGGLVLHELKKLPALNGFSFKDLSESRQRKVKNRSIRGIVLSEHADQEARFDLFERINTGSKVANDAEVRRGALTGPFIDLVIELAKDEKFVRLAPVSPRDLKERAHEELVTRFFAYGDGLSRYKDNVKPFLYDYTERMNKEFLEDAALVEKYRRKFHMTMDFVEASFPYGFRRTLKGTATPRSRFEALAVGSFLALKTKPDLAPNPTANAIWLKSEEFKKEIRSDGANAIARLEGRIHFVRDSLLGVR